MGDVGDTFNAIRAARKERRRANKPDNAQAIAESGVPHTVTNNGEAILFRQAGKPDADFYPSTGRWRSGGRTYNGGAVAFLRWYAKRGVIND